MSSQNRRHYSPADRLLMQADAALRTLLPFSGHPGRPSPAVTKNDASLNDKEARHVAGLMRINHTGEVCAQALYQGQSLTARLPQVRERMEKAAEEEIDHLAWCEQRLHQLDSHTSVLNPLFYGLSFGIGATAGMISDRLSLGFVAATEDQVCKHLDDHLTQLPLTDEKSRAILEQMRLDEARHSAMALNAGGMRFPLPVKFGMSLLSKVMTKTTYRI
ncbi:2-polyprenyl-3-methyl-6-methoxy-1,4-benzoquinone monooxygenase [Azomonas macrocytogenes]|uniref:3-demethoxyubiquinol 3-hydroxylase n=1 Tax=Azomonas macrocytogenes TaxID=69962 RepID=A0A839SXI4_AZOMA|nr:2-polyprenyl-3-methyl-6-methoxy-1,4-benzoquinone monooxygenase [Azomonas macrocytogenes]MBB3102071.1 ubiquinone biosynthesis monooxygenase Coq7 [Azomonas macrocytogenes]